MTVVDSQLSFSHIVAKLMGIKNVLRKTSLNCAVNDSEMLLNDF